MTMLQKILVAGLLIMPCLDAVAERTQAEQEKMKKDYKQFLIDGQGSVKAASEGAVVGDESGLPPKIDASSEGLQGRVMFWNIPNWYGYYGNHRFEKFKDDRDWVKDAMDRMQRMGVTDIVLSSVGLTAKGYIGLSGELPPHFFSSTYSSFKMFCKSWGKDPLIVYAEECQKRGMKMWIVFHGLADIGAGGEAIKDHEFMYAKDLKGNRILGPLGEKRGSPYDILTDMFLKQYFCVAIDEIDKRLKTAGLSDVMQGIMFNEEGSTFYNTYEAHADKFAAWSKEQFGETPPAGIEKKMALWRKWHDPKDVWWRRFMLWRSKVQNDFKRKMVDYIHSKGWKAIDYGYGDYTWYSAQNPAHADIFDKVYFSSSSTRGTQVDNECKIAHCTKNIGTHAHARVVDGNGDINIFSYGTGIGHVLNRDLLLKNMGEKFVESYCRYIPRIEDECTILCRNVRRWTGAKTLCRTAILDNQMARVAKTAAYREEYKKLWELQYALETTRQVRLIDLGLPRYINKYKALFINSSGARFMSEKSYGQLMKHVKKGSVLISLMTDWSCSRIDLTQEKDRTSETLGIEYTGDFVPQTLDFLPDSPVLAGLKLTLPSGVKAKAVQVTDGKDTKVIAEMRSADGSAVPAVTVKKTGQGHVLSFNFDVLPLLLREYRGTGYPVFTTVINETVNAYAGKPLLCSEGKIYIKEGLKKGGDIGVSILGQPAPELRKVVHAGNWSLPESGKILVNKSVLKRGKRYTVTSRCRGFADRIKSPSGKDEWTVDELVKQGIPVTVSFERQFELLEIEKVKGFLWF